MGIVLLYIDVDGDKRWNDDGFEPLVGGSTGDIVLWAPEGLDGEVVGDPIGPGFYSVFPERDGLCVDEEFVPLDFRDERCLRNDGACFYGGIFGQEKFRKMTTRFPILWVFL